MQTTPLDLPSILLTHAGFHARLKDGEFEGAPEGTFVNALSKGQLRPIVNAIGVKGVGDLLHVVHELIMEVFRDNAKNGSPVEATADVLYVMANLNAVMNWATLAAVFGMLPMGPPTDDKGISF